MNKSPIKCSNSRPELTLLLVSLLVFAPVTFAGNVVTTADSKAILLNILAGAAVGASDSTFSASVYSQDSDNLRIGSSIQFTFGTDTNCYITMIVINSESVVSIIQPFENGYLPAKIFPALYPESDSLEKFEVAPPTGIETVQTFCTQEPLLVNELDGVAGYNYDGTDATNLLMAVVTRISQLEAGSYAQASWKQRITGRSVLAQYNDTDVVDYFATKTRSIKRKRLPLEIKFEYASARLTGDALGTLDMIGKALSSENLRSRHFRIGGHTDAIGSDEYNLTLSEQRANTARDYLQSQFNISHERLSVSPYGEHFPKADNESKQGRAENRRVELQILTNE